MVAISSYFRGVSIGLILQLEVAYTKAFKVPQGFLKEKRKV